MIHRLVIVVFVHRHAWTDGDDLHHAGMHVEKQVTVKRPITHMVSSDVKGQLIARFDVDGMLARFVIAFVDDEIEEHAVEVDRMGHHRVVDERDPQPFAFMENNRVDDMRKLYAVERPHVAFHIAGQVNLQFPAGFAFVRVRLKAFQLSIGQRSVRNVFKSKSRFVETVGRRHGDIIDAEAGLVIVLLHRVAGHVM